MRSTLGRRSNSPNKSRAQHNQRRGRLAISAGCARADHLAFALALFFLSFLSRLARCSRPFQRSSFQRGGSLLAFHASHSFCSSAALAGLVAAKLFFSPGSLARLNSIGW